MRKDTNRIITAPVKNEPIPKSYASASLLTELMVGKYVDHLPFYRQIQMFKRIGFSLPPSTIESWFHEVADLMRPAYYRLKELVLSSDYVQSDETTIPIINNEKHQTIKGIIVICCWAHARRYFERALKHDKARAEYGKVLPKSPIGQAMHYFLNHVRQLAHYTMDGKYCIDNNLIENSARPIAVGRKNFLFCGNHDAAEDAAVIYSFMGCCKAADVDFKGWMNYFLNHVHEYDSDYSRDLAELLPSSLKDRKIL